MYVEPSAVLAILKEETDATVYRDRLAVASSKVITVVGKVEAAISLGRALNNYSLGPDVVDRFCVDADISVMPVYPDLYAEAWVSLSHRGLLLLGSGQPSPDARRPSRAAQRRAPEASRACVRGFGATCLGPSLSGLAVSPGV